MKKNKEKKGFHVLIAAAGSGQRFGGAVPKQYVTLCGKPLIRHSVETFSGHPDLASLRVIIDPEHADWYHEALKDIGLPDFIPGNKNRFLSINNSLKYFSNLKNEDIILIHDAARPCLKREDLDRLLAEMDFAKAASLAAPVSETLRYADGGKAGRAADRTNLWALQTPQAFEFGVLKQAHNAADPALEHSDDTTLVSALGIDVKLIPGSKTNIKITTPEDLEIAQGYLNTVPDIRSGQGFDVHAFEKHDKKRPLMLCGVKVEHEFGLAGHSDADVAMHAVTDALLGAIGAGDIGRHFPPSDNTYKDMDSAVFLKEAVNMVRNQGGSVQNVDVTIICEVPKIGPHAVRMQENLAQILDVEKKRINIKATTTEQLGFTGRKEGIAAQAIATVKLS